MDTQEYLFVLGRNPELSRIELSSFCEEVLYDGDKSLLLAKNLKFTNPRNLPKEKEQLFLDGLGGTIRIAKVLGEVFSEDELFEEIKKQVIEQKPEGKIQLGISVWGCGRSFLKSFLPKIKNIIKDSGRNCRTVNQTADNLDSGKIFGEKLLRKGFEFIIWKRGDSYLVTQTVANQNLRNYTLRDRQKDFRDAKMGMLPPKLAQILINLARPSLEQTVIDTFCGSGTIGIEAAITGFNSVNSDIDSDRVSSSKDNFQKMSEKFRYEFSTGEFKSSNAINFPYNEYENAVIVTEGTLGENFEKRPLRSKIEKEKSDILSLWKKIFKNLEETTISKIVLCLPVWHYHDEEISISKDLFNQISPEHFNVPFTFNTKKTFIYKRDKTFVGREICVVERV